MRRAAAASVAVAVQLCSRLDCCVWLCVAVCGCVWLCVAVAVCVCWLCVWLWLWLCGHYLQAWAARDGDLRGCGRIPSHDVAMFVASAGTICPRRLYARTHTQLVQSAVDLQQVLQLDGTDVTATALPPSAVGWAEIGLLAPLYGGAAVIVWQARHPSFSASRFVEVS